MAIYQGTKRADTYSGTDQNDELYGNGGNDALHGAGGDDLVVGGDGDDQVYGDGGDDWIEGGAGRNLILGGSGDDVIVAEGRDVIDGGDGDDEINLLRGSVISGNISGGAGYDVLIFGDENQVTFDGKSGSAIFSGFEEVSGPLNGTAKNDTVDLSGLTAPSLMFSGVRISCRDGNDTVTGGAERDYIDGEAGNDTLNGGTGDDGISGGLGRNFLYGGAGRDFIDVQGQDIVDGGEGDDTVGLSGTITAISIAGGAGFDTLQFPAIGDVANVSSETGATIFSGFERITGRLVGGEGADAIDLSPLTDPVLAKSVLGMNCGGGNDRFSGGTEQDYVSGEAGNDVLSGGAGRDQIVGDAGDDVLDGGADDDVLNGGEGIDKVSGGDGNDRVTFASNATVDGGAGNDQVNSAFVGGAGTISGGDGIDTLTFNTATFSSGSVRFTRFERIEGALFGTSGDDQLDFSGLTDPELQRDTRNAPIQIKAGSGNDTVSGGAECDFIVGDDGNDTLTGGLGDDDLSGGAGADVFRFTDLTSHDRIFDFAQAELDRIDLGALDANSPRGGRQAFTFIGATKFSGHAGELRYSFSGSSSTRLEGDVDGDSSADFTVLVTRHVAFVTDDFILTRSPPLGAHGHAAIDHSHTGPFMLP